MSDTEILWRPTAAAVESSNLTAYIDWLRAERGVDLAAYPELWQWSVDDLEGFWNSIVDYFGVAYDGERGPALGSREMPGAAWYPGIRVNWAERAFAGKDHDQVAILHASELRELDEITWGELRARVAACAAGLRSLGVVKGDRVVAYLPNIAEAVVAFLATASIGAVWSSASPDFGAGSLIDRFAQIEPKVLIAINGYRYGGKDFDRTPVVAELQAAMPGLERTVLILWGAKTRSRLRDGVEHLPGPARMRWPDPGRPFLRDFICALHRGSGRRSAAGGGSRPRSRGRGGARHAAGRAAPGGRGW